MTRDVKWNRFKEQDVKIIVQQLTDHSMHPSIRTHCPMGFSPSPNQFSHPLTVISKQNATLIAYIY